MRWLAALLVLSSCSSTEEVRAWVAHREALERRLAEQLQARGDVGWALTLQELDVAGFVRTHQLAAQVFVEAGVTRVRVTGTAEQCRDALVGLAPVRWLISGWNLRLEAAQCTWEGRTSSEFAELERALLAPPERWSPPPASIFSRGVERERARVHDLEARLAKLDARPVISEATLARIAALRHAPAPCDLAILERELAQDTRGALLEIADDRLVHPLEPSSDARLRGLVDKGPQWHCQ